METDGLPVSDNHILKHFPAPVRKPRIMQDVDGQTGCAPFEDTAYRRRRKQSIEAIGIMKSYGKMHHPWPAGRHAPAP